MHQIFKYTLVYEGDRVSIYELIIEHPFVSIHTHETICRFFIQVAGKLYCVIQNLISMVKSVLNAFFHEGDSDRILILIRSKDWSDTGGIFKNLG
jgi:hypothetical protein